MFLLDSRVIWAAEEGWLVFDVTATSNHWVLNPGRNLGLQLALESTKGESVYFLAGGKLQVAVSAVSIQDKEDKVPDGFTVHLCFRFKKKKKKKSSR